MLYFKYLVNYYYLNKEKKERIIKIIKIINKKVNLMRKKIRKLILIKTKFSLIKMIKLIKKKQIIK